jgi:hypothetical protein
VLVPIFFGFLCKFLMQAPNIIYIGPLNLSNLLLIIPYTSITENQAQKAANSFLLYITHVSPFRWWLFVPSCIRPFSHLKRKSPLRDGSVNTVVSCPTPLTILITFVYTFCLPIHGHIFHTKWLSCHICCSASGMMLMSLWHPLCARASLSVALTSM